MNLPNKLSLLRIILVPVFAVVFYLPYAFAPYVAVAIFAVAAFTDFLDGKIARKYNLVTDLGKLLDPIADKLLITCALIVAVSANVLSSEHFRFAHIFLAACAVVIIGRELLVSALRQIAAAKGIVLSANVYGKIKTVVQDVALPVLLILKARRYDTLLPATFYDVVWWIALVLISAATILTIVSGAVYMVQNRAVFKSDK